MDRTINLREIGERICRLRESMDMTQEDLALCLHVDRRTIIRVEKGQRSSSLQMLADLAKLLEIPTDYILFGEDNPGFQSNDLLLMIPEEAREEVLIGMRHIINALYF